MKGLAQFQEDLQIIRRAIYTGQVSAIKLEAQAALMRIRRFAETLENLDLTCSCHGDVHRADCPARPK